MDYSDIKEVHDKYESIIDSLKAQFAKFSEERNKRETMIEKEVGQVEYMDIPITLHVKNFIEWDTSYILVGLQIIETYDKYLESLYGQLKNIKNQKERIVELTEELEKKEEDLELMSDIVREKEGEITALKTEKEKILIMAKRLKESTQFGNKPIAKLRTEEAENERDSLFEELMSEKPKKTGGKRVCEKCGKDISYRKTNAKYCVECYYLTMKESDRLAKARKRKFDKKGDEIAEGTDEDELKVEDEGYEEGNGPENEPLDEEAEYEDKGVVEAKSDEDES